MADSQPSSKRDKKIARVVKRNIAAVMAARDRAERKAPLRTRIADAVTAASGSMWFVYLHVLWFGVWIAWNLGFLQLEPFDPFPFGLLTMIVSLEAIFLSTFVLISQNRQAGVDARRADLDLQIDLLAEYEVTRLLCLVSAIAEHLKVPLPSELMAHQSDLCELEKDVHPTALLKALERRDEKL